MRIRVRITFLAAAVVGIFAASSPAQTPETGEAAMRRRAIDAGYRGHSEHQFDLDRPGGLTSPWQNFHIDSEFINRKE